MLQRALYFSARRICDPAAESSEFCVTSPTLSTALSSCAELDIESMNDCSSAVRSVPIFLRATRISTAWRWNASRVICLIFTSRCKVAKRRRN